MSSYDEEDQDLSDKTFALGSDYIAVKRLGKGTYGTVYLVKKKDTGKLYAVKEIKNESESEGIPATALREIAVLKKMTHPNIVSVEGMAYSDKHLELCLEYCEYDLRKLILEKRFDDSFYNENFIKKILFQVFKAVDYLHSHKILHRDLKPANILVKENDLTVKLADFGLARVYSIPIRPYTKEVLTLWYRAPEMLLGISQYAIGLDLWSLGCIVGEMYLQRPLFHGNTELEQLFMIMKVFGTFNDVMLPGYKAYPNFNKDFPFWKGSGLRNYIDKKALVQMDDVAFDLLEKLLVIDPVKRMTCKEALEHPYFKGMS